MQREGFQSIEKLVLNWRLFIIIPVIASLLSSLIMVAVGTITIGQSFLKLPDLVYKGRGDTIHSIELDIIGGIDAYLVATVLIVFSLGLYELFIRKLDIKQRGSQALPALIVKDLEQLKEKIGKLVLMILVVLFFKHALMLPYHNARDLLMLGLGILFVALSMFFGHRDLLRAGWVRRPPKEEG